MSTIPLAGPPARRAFLTGLVDYAGLFPPANLDLEPAVQNFARYRTGPEAWMLGRFIVPAARLADLDAHADLFAQSPPVRFSVLGAAPSAPGLDPWLGAARQSLSDARSFDDRHLGQTVCDRFELKLPAPLVQDVDGLVGSLGDLASRAGTGPDAPRFALEVPFDVAPGATAPAAHAVAEANARAGRPAFALKLRCGGVTAEAFPGVESLAAAIVAARDADAPFKATAGLHHPVRQDRDEVGAAMHGFVNVFGGAVLARLHGLDADALAEILDDEDPAHFALGDALRWRSLAASAAETADARSQFALSYGSCSFDEPRDDLRALGWL